MLYLRRYLRRLKQTHPLFSYHGFSQHQNPRPLKGFPSLSNRNIPLSHFLRPVLAQVPPRGTHLLLHPPYTPFKSIHFLFQTCSKAQNISLSHSPTLPPSWQKIQRINRLRILLILPFPLNKRFQRTNRLGYLLFPLTKFQGTNNLRSLSQHIGGYILCGTSRGYIYLGYNTENKRGYISCGSVQVEGTSTWFL